MITEQRRFEDDRIALFARYGVEMTARRVADRRGRETYLLDSGGSGDPLMLLHGGGSEGSIWAPIAGRFADRHRVLVPDRPGCGLSYPIAYGGFDFRAAAAEWFSEVVDGLELDAVDVMGNSMGGFFSIAYGLSERSRARRIAFAGAPAGLDRWGPWPLRFTGLKGVNRLVFALAGEMDADGLQDLYRKMLVADADALDQDYLEVWAAGGALPGAQVGWRTLLEECVTLFGFRRRYMLRDDFPELDVPILMVWGEEDAFASPDSGEALAEQMRNARLVRVPAAGHLPWLDAPDAVVDPVRQFLSGHHAGS